MRGLFLQCFPPQPNLTEKNLPSQAGKVFMVTGATSGVGKQLTQILYAAGAKIYLAVRSEAKARQTIQSIQDSFNASEGSLHYLYLNLADLSTIKKTAETFLSLESKLHVLWNNAGIATPSPQPHMPQGNDAQMTVNCLAPQLLTYSLLPALRAAAKESPPGDVRIVWTSSIAIETAPINGLTMESLNDPTKNSNVSNYIYSKLGNWFLAHEMGCRESSNGILSVTQNPGNLKTEILRDLPKLLQIIPTLWLYDAKYGAYTELFCGLSKELTIEDSGCYVVPWGRKNTEPRKDLMKALQARQEGGSGLSEDFWNWCDERIKPFK